MSWLKLYLNVALQYLIRGSIYGSIGGFLTQLIWSLCVSIKYPSPSTNTYPQSSEMVIQGIGLITLFGVIGGVFGAGYGTALGLVHGLVTAPIITTWLHLRRTHKFVWVILLVWALTSSFMLTVVSINLLRIEISPYYYGTLLTLDLASVPPASLAALGALHTTFHILWKNRPIEVKPIALLSSE